MLEFAGPLVSKRGLDPQDASVFDRYAASTRSLLGMFRFSPLLQKSQSTVFPKEISDLGTLALSSRSLKILDFLQQRFTTSWPHKFFFPPFLVWHAIRQKNAQNTPLLRQETARSRVLPGGSDFASELVSLSPLNLQMLEIPVSGGISGEVSRANAMVSLSFPVPKMLDLPAFRWHCKKTELASLSLPNLQMLEIPVSRGISATNVQTDVRPLLPVKGRIQQEGPKL